jgi:hypothetical protein
MINYKEYRDDLAKKLKKQREFFKDGTGKELAKTFLEKEKKTDNYKKAEGSKYADLLENEYDSKIKLTKKLNKNAANKLINTDNRWAVGRRLKKFGLLDKNIGNHILRSKNSRSVAKNLEKFE